MAYAEFIEHVRVVRRDVGDHYVTGHDRAEKIAVPAGAGRKLFQTSAFDAEFLHRRLENRRVQVVEVEHPAVRIRPYASRQSNIAGLHGVPAGSLPTERWMHLS